MATQNICFYNKYGFCKYLETCRKYHENKMCENSNCEVRDCPLRHPISCKWFKDFGFCKFNEWCRFSHEVTKNTFEQNEEVKNLKEKMKDIETELEKKSEKILKLEAEIKDIHLKMTEKDQTVSKINKKFNFLKEKVTLLFDMETKIDIIEKTVEKFVNKPVETKDSTEEKAAAENISTEVKCDLCDFVAKNKFGLKIHFHKKHSTAKFNCFTCDFTCETHRELVDHNDQYFYSHRQKLNKDYEKHILDEFQRLDEDGYLIHRKLDW